MKPLPTLILLLISMCFSSVWAEPEVDQNAHGGAPTSSLQQKTWIHGSTDCESNNDPAIEVYRYTDSSFIFRQNKCLSFEAPFMYLLTGEKQALLLDSGATEGALEFPIYDTVKPLLDGQPGTPGKQLLVIHSHGHSDHYAGDSQFEGKPNVTVISPHEEAVRVYFNFANWPEGEAIIDLGGRTLSIMPAPGHQEEAIAVYDPETRWLLTGDTLYPGYVYVKNWDEYRNSIARLTAFSQSHQVDAILGTHIEMTSRPGEYYPIGTVYQPDEAPLNLRIENLFELQAELQKSKRSKKIVFDEFIVAPMNLLQRTLSNAARLITR